MYFANSFKPGIYLLKIHGALDVFAFNEGEDLLKLLPNAPGQKGVIDVLRAPRMRDFSTTFPVFPVGMRKPQTRSVIPTNKA